MADKGFFEDPKKSAYDMEYYESSWEKDYMQELESDDSIAKWTKNHGLRIPYLSTDNKRKTYIPDFLVEKTDGSIQLIEMKATHQINSPITKQKKEYATKWCNDRSIQYRLISRYQ